MISIIIPTNCDNSEARISRLKMTLLSLEKQLLDKKQYEVIVVLNNTTLLKQDLQNSSKYNMDITFLEHECPGMGSAYNYGISKSKYNYILLGLDDILYHKSNLSEHLKKVKSDENIVSIGIEKYITITKRISNISSPFLPQLIKNKDTDFMKYIDLGNYKINEESMDDYTTLELISIIPPKVRDIYSTIRKDKYSKIHWLGMRVGNHALSKKLFNLTEGFDEKLDYGDSWYSDIDLGIKLYKLGAKFSVTENCKSFNMMRDKNIDYYNAQTNYELIMNKYPYIDVCFIPMFFAYGENYSMKDYSEGINNISSFISTKTLGESHE